MHNSVCGMDRAGPLNCMRLMAAKLMAEIDSQTLVEGTSCNSASRDSLAPQAPELPSRA